MNVMEDVGLADESAIPGHRNYLIYCDESGIDGSVYYGFGSLWMPWERRGDFLQIVQQLRDKHHYRDEIKWHHVKKSNESFYRDLVVTFFTRRWLMFHALVVRKGYSDGSFHNSFDEEKRKRFTMLMVNKIQFFCGRDQSKSYHVRVDPLPSSYKKADEAAFKITESTLKKGIGLSPLKSLYTRDSRSHPGIQLADFLIGATLADWQGRATAVHKIRVCRLIAEHLGWADLHADTHLNEWKFNIWYFFDPTAGRPREVCTRSVKLKIPMPTFRQRRNPRLS